MRQGFIKVAALTPEGYRGGHTGEPEGNLPPDG